VSPRTDMDAMGKRNVFALPGLELGPLCLSPRRHELYRLDIVRKDVNYPSEHRYKRNLSLGGAEEKQEYVVSRNGPILDKTPARHLCGALALQASFSVAQAESACTSRMRKQRADHPRAFTQQGTLLTLQF
jgi:hypothetical protein